MKKVIMIIAVAAILVGCKGKGTRVQISDSVDKFKVEKLFVVKYFANYQTHRAFTCLVTNGCHFRGYEDETFENSFKNLLFADGTPFGVKVEK